MQSQIELNLQPQSRLPELRLPSAQLFSRQQLLLGTIAAISTVIGDASFLAVQAASLTNWNFDPAANQLEITVKDGTTPRYFLMAQPARIVIDLPGTAVGDVSAQKTYAGAVRQIRVSQFEPGLTRIVMEISPGVSLAPGQVKLQKVGDRAAQASNSRWVLQPLVTKSLSTNAVTVQPTAAQPTRPVSSITSVPTPTTASISPAPLNTNAPQQPQTPAIANNLPSPPPSVGSGNTTPTSGIATDGSSPSSNIPTTPIALAPVLPAAPTQRAATQTPLPPTTAVNSIDPNVGIDTSKGTAIAVPSPTAMPSTPVAPQATSPQASPQIAASTASSVALAPTNSRSTPSPAPASTARPDSLAAADIPLSLAAQPSTVAPSVSVPPLGDQVPRDRGATPASRVNTPATIRQPEASSETLSSFPTRSNSQPRVSVPPLIQVGTPSLGVTNPAPLSVEATPSDPSSLGAAPSSVSVPPLQRVSSPQPSTATSTPAPATAGVSYDANTIRQAPSAAPLTNAGTYDANTIRQPSTAANLAPPLQVTPLQSPVAPTIATPTYDANTVRQDVPTSPAAAPVVEFGQPLPTASDATRVSGQPLASVNQSPGVRQAFKPVAPNVLLPAGTTLSLQYPGNSALSLRTDSPQQEVLVLQTDLRDAAGNLLAPAGSLVTGRFETTTAGSQFVTQAIALTGSSLPLAAQSETLDGTRKVTSTDLARNSGIGILAGGVLGAIGGSTGLGAIGGAAAGAAATLVTSPKPAMIQPGQLIQVRLTQDLSL